jgi:hypothetical protein
MTMQKKKKISANSGRKKATENACSYYYQKRIRAANYW